MDLSPHDSPSREQERICTRGHRSPATASYCADCGEPVQRGVSPVWATVGDALVVVRYAPHLARTLLTAVIVGTVLFCINQLDVVVAGDADAIVGAKIALTYVVPFVVSNIGILIATHRPRDGGTS